LLVENKVTFFRQVDHWPGINGKVDVFTDHE